MTPDPMTLDDLIDAQEAHDDGRLARWGFTTTSTGKTPDGDARQARGQDEDEDHDSEDSDAQ